MATVYQTEQQIAEWIREVLASQKEYTIPELYEAVAKKWPDGNVKIHAIYTALAGLVGSRSVLLTPGRKYRLA